MTLETWQLIDASFLRWPQSKATVVDANEFDMAMQGYDPIDADYREFVLRYGGAIVGSSPIYGLRKAEFMGTIGGKATAPEITNWFRAKNWVGIDDWLVFSIDQGGNPIGFAKSGGVWLSDQLDFQQVMLIASNFEDYLLKWCFNTKPLD